MASSRCDASAAAVSVGRADVQAQGRASRFRGAIAVGLTLAFILLAGGALGLASVKTELWGGLTLTLLVSYTGIAASLPLGLALALARRSSWPVPRWLAVAMIEFWRGVPLVTVLFMASFMLPLFLPEGVTVNKLARALIAIAYLPAPIWRK